MQLIAGDEFAALMAALALPEPPRRLAVAVSGGADSMALALLAKDWATAHGTELTALTVNHGLRPEAAAEVEQVRSWLEAKGIPCVILAPTIPITGSNIQEKARKLRYGLMAEWCSQYDCPYLLVAHHADDQLETVLLRLIRAGGVEGLAGMRPVREYQGITLLRPLLPVPKARLIATLQARGQAWLEDPSNQSPAYTRNRLRPVAKMLAGEGLTPERVTLLTRQLAATADYLEAEVVHWLSVHVESRADGQMSVPLAAWREVPPEIGWRALKRLLQEVGGAEKPMRSEKLLPLFNVLAAGEMIKPRTLGGCLLTPDMRSGALSLRREP